MITIQCVVCGSDRPIYPSEATLIKTCSNICSRIRKAGGGSFAERFWSRVQVGAEDECWPWLGATNRTRYGMTQTMFQATENFAHRQAYLLVVGPIPGGLLVLHSCDNPPCCNPAHLRVGTHADNTRDKMERGRAWNGRGKRPSALLNT